ncbi:META domain-containing protein [Streptomyces sp. 15-116A]|uniref:META domain-containing protein n=1 Tax=Streptomyces sp. 15-116A TaxID=2259035 RepID=UPI0021B3F66F|nr:META domain-containing protein [Streptomyces sp. 15-116A]MCT7352469.1 META domain-containing protein [Streptomyces sp. 15-116A]
MYRQKRHTQRTILTAAVAALVPLAAACGTEKAGGGSSSAEPAAPVTGIRWSIDSVTVDGTTHRAPSDAHVTLADDGRSEGSYGCNTFSARTDVDGDRIRLSDAMSTEMACDDKPMAFESTLARTLTDGGALKAEVNDDRLTLTTADGATIRLTRSQDAALHGTKWTVTTPATDSRAHLTFDKDEGTVSGNLGCNDVNAKATVRDGRIILGPPAATRMMCEDSLMDGERALMKLFDGTVEYRIDHRTLTLTSENGTSVRAVAAR